MGDRSSSLAMGQRRLLLLIFSLCLRLWPQGLHAAAQTSFPELAGRQEAINANDERVKWVGRRLVMPTERGVVFDDAGVVASLTVSNATRLDIAIRDTTLWGTSFGVYADGVTGLSNSQRINTIHTRAGLHSYTLINNLHALTPYGGPVVLRVLHLQEAYFIGAYPGRNLTILSFSTDGHFGAAPPPSPRRLEIIGDSISTGFGTLTPCNASGLGMNDYSLSFSRSVCDALQADCLVEATSAVGVMCGWPRPTEDPLKVCNNMTMPGRWNETLGGVPRKHPWDHSTFIPQAVVLQLGGNDLCCGRENIAAFRSRWIESYIDFVARISDIYGPSTQFFLCVGPLYYPPTKQAFTLLVQNVVQRLNALNIHAHALDMSVEMTVKGCFGHPTAFEHMQIAAKVQAALQRVLGWGEGDGGGHGVGAGEEGTAVTSPQSRNRRLRVDEVHVTE